MKRGKNFFENEKLLVYVGTAIFIMLAISIGIVMYMTADANVNKSENIGKTSENSLNTVNKVETDKEENTSKSVSTEIGKSVEEQEEKSNTSNSSVEEKVNEKTTETTSKNENVNVDEKKVEENNKTENKTETKTEIKFVKPVEGEIIGGFAKENLIYSETLKEWITHTGIDIKSDKTSVVKSSADGIVKSIVNDPRYGLTVTIEHADGYKTIYANLLTSEFVVEGEEVKAGQTIGTVGNTASFESNMEYHLHFEIMKDGEYVDPNIYLK